MSSPRGSAYADLVPPGALASEPSESEADSNADFSYETDVEGDGLSDGDPPGLDSGLARRPTISGPPPIQPATVRQLIAPQPIQPALPPPIRPTSIVLTHRESAPGDVAGKVAPRISRRRTFTNLEKDAWFSPDEFYAEVAELAARQQDLGLIVVDDRSHVSARPFLHIGCVYRRSGCPFLLKCLYRKAEGGWVLRSETVEGTDRLDPKNGSIFHCIHHPGAVREVATPLPYTTKFKQQEADKPRPAKKARPSLPAPTSTYAPQTHSQPPRSASNGAISTTYKMPDIAPARPAVNGRDGGGASAGPSRVSSGGEGVRALAPPFTRAQHLAAQVSPALAGAQAGMRLGTAYAGHTGAPGDAPLGRGTFPHPENLERRPPPAPGTFPNTLTPVIIPAGVPQGYLPAAPAPSHHAAYFAAFRPPTYPLPIVAPRYPQPPSGILPMWQHFFHQLDPALIPLAPILANEAVGVTLAGFYNNPERVRRALVAELAKFGATAFLRTVFGEKMEVEGRRVFEGLMEKAQERRERVAAVAREKEKEREERDKVERERTEKEKGAVEVEVEDQEEGDAMEVDQPGEANGTKAPEAATGTTGLTRPPGSTSTSAPSAPAGDLAIRQSTARPVVSIAPAPSSEVPSAALGGSSKPASVDRATANGNAAKAEGSAGPAAVPVAAEASVTPAPERAQEEPVIDSSLPDLEIEWVTNPVEMVARMAANGFEYLSIFRRTFYKRRPEERDLTGPELRTFFKGYELESVFADKMGWHITLGGPKEADRAYRALRNKKKLWGVPLLFDLCAAAGKVGSVQERPATTEELGSRLRKAVLPVAGAAEDELRRQEKRTRKAQRAAEAKEAAEERARAIAAGAVNVATGRTFSQEEAERERMNDPNLPVPVVEYCSSGEGLRDRLGRNGLAYVQIRPRSQRVVAPKDSVPKRVRYAVDWIKDELEAVLANYKGWYLIMTEPDAAHVLVDYLQDDAEYVVTECEPVVPAPGGEEPKPAVEGGAEGGGEGGAAPSAGDDADRDGTPMQISDGEAAPENTPSPAVQLPSSPARAAVQTATPAAPAAPLPDATQASTSAAHTSTTQPESASTPAAAPVPASRPTASPTAARPLKAPGKAIGPFSKLPTKAPAPGLGAVARRQSAGPAGVGAASSASAAPGGTLDAGRSASPGTAVAVAVAGGGQDDQLARNLASIPGLGSGSRPPTPTGGGSGGSPAAGDDKKASAQGATEAAPAPFRARLMQPSSRMGSSPSGSGGAGRPGASLPGTPVGVQPKAPRKSLW